MNSALFLHPPKVRPKSPISTVPYKGPFSSRFLTEISYQIAVHASDNYYSPKHGHNSHICFYQRLSI
jgi:hypothetical protein